MSAVIVCAGWQEMLLKMASAKKYDTEAEM